jgi:hypothetical protein
MRFHKIIRVSLTFLLADKSAVGAINRPLQSVPDEFVNVHVIIQVANSCRLRTLLANER